MEHYVTLFDSNYIYQGISLYKSLERNSRHFKLWVVCVDENTYTILSKLKLSNLTPLRLADFETSALLAVKSDRKLGEYCWTLTPFVFDFVFSIDLDIKRLTYVDADVWIRKSPSPIFQELESVGKLVLITDHGYAPEYDASATSGQYCVQFLTFYKDGTSHIRSQWQSQCLEWCYDRMELNKFGDQKYLDAWPENFPNEIHVLANREWTLAPWNASRFPYGNSILYHFHGLKISLNEAGEALNFRVDGAYILPEVLKRNIYIPYIQELNESFRLLKFTDPS